jgi:hypothetical protein
MPKGTMRLSPALLAVVAAATLGLPTPARAQEFPAPTLQGAPSPFAPPPMVMMRPTVMVHVKADQPVMLEALGPQDTRWTRVCVAPCDMEVPLDSVYRVTGPGMVPSRTVELEAAPRDRVTLDVGVRTTGDHRTGEGLYVASWVAAGVGLALGAGALAMDPSSTAEPILLWSGIGVEGAMVAMAITSYVLLQPSGLSQSVTRPEPGRVGGGPDTLTRLPIWREANTSSLSAPRVTTVPIFSTSF